MHHRFAFRRYSLPLRAPIRTAHGWWPVRDGLIVRLQNDRDVVGFGEVAPIPWFGTETLEDAEEVCRNLGDNFDDDRLENIPESHGCVRFALASARGEVAREAQHAYLPVAALLPAGKPALEKVRIQAEAGFRTFKWKVGVADVADELSLLDDLVAELPAGAKLRLDANGAWDRRRAERWLERCADRPVEFVEQPIAADAKGADDLLRGLAEDHPTPIALDESLVRARDVERWLDAGWPGIFVIKPALFGETTKALERLRLAGGRVVFSSALETALGAQAALRVAFSFPGEPRALGFGVWPLFADGRFDGPWAAPFIRMEDVERLDAEAIWNALT